MSVETRIDNKHQPANTNEEANALVLIDTHVHIYDCFELGTLLHSAWDNFKSVANTQGSGNAFTGILLLTETAQYNWFEEISAQLAQQADSTLSQDDWTFSTTSEACSLYAADPQGKKLLLVAGRQVITSEKLEVLALITHETVADGLSAEETIQAIQANNGIVVLPWGVGKWLGKRGKLISNLLKMSHLSPFFLGDNSGRPQFWSRPSYFQAIEQQGRQVLPGTDPLPLASEATRPGSFGLTMAGNIDANAPGKQLREWFLDPQANWKPYGALETPWGFLRNQLAMRVTSNPKKSQD